MTFSIVTMRALFFVLSFLPLTLATLQVGFYSTSCPQAESVVESVVENRFFNDFSIAPALLRMYFHDCFVNGCDASLLIAPTEETPSEQSAGPNLTVRGFEIIAEIKSNLEAVCPNTVSCADIIALATRDAVVQSGGLNYDVPTGRRDGLRSDPNDVFLPGPSLTVSQALSFFTAKGLSLNDMVVLLGSHTLGVAHCTFFRDRLGDFKGTGKPDPTMNKTLLTELNKTCGPVEMPLDQDPTAFLDQNTSFFLDNSYYKQLLLGNGILQIDEELAFDKSTANLVKTLANDSSSFLQLLTKALVKLGNVQVLEGNAGEIRKNCSIFNALLPPPVQSPPTSPPLSAPPRNSPSPSPSPLPSRSNTPSPSPLPSRSNSPSPSPLPSRSNSPSPSPSSLPPRSNSPSPSPLPSRSNSPSPSPLPSRSNSPSPSPSPVPSRSNSPSPSPSPSSLPPRSNSPSPSPTPLPPRSNSPPPSPSPLPLSSQSNSPSPSPLPSRSNSPPPSSY